MNIEQLLNRMKKLELCLIPEFTTFYIHEQEIGKKAEVRLRLEELHLEYREVMEAYQDKLREAREEVTYSR